MSRVVEIRAERVVRVVSILLHPRIQGGGLSDLVTRGQYREDVLTDGYRGNLRIIQYFLVYRATRVRTPVSTGA